MNVCFDCACPIHGLRLRCVVCEISQGRVNEPTATARPIPMLTDQTLCQPRKPRQPWTMTAAERRDHAMRTKPRTRRTPAEIIAELEAKRDRLGDRSDVIQERIERTQRRYRKSLALDAFAGTDAEELQAQLDRAKLDTRLLRQALNAKLRDGAS